MSSKNTKKAVAPKKKQSKSEAKKKPGQPTKYKSEYNEQARKLCMLGCTDVELADFFKVHVDSIYEWKKRYPTFSEAIKAGKEVADAEVASKLFHRATGYEHEEIDIKVINGKIVKTPLRKHYAPDTVAAIFWLKNRQPGKWRDKVEVDNTNKNINYNVELTPEEVKEIAKELEDEY